MALDDEDMKVIAKLVSDGVKSLNEKREAKLLDALSSKLDEALTEKLSAAEKAKAEAAKAPNPEVEERKTLTMRVKELEAERDKARADARQERTNTAFRKAWNGAKFVGELADDHMAALDKAGRLHLEDDGTVRVKDPRKHASETQPTLEEYMGELAKSEKGRLYQAARTTPGGGASSFNGAAQPKREYNPAALDAIFGESPGE